MLGAMQLATHPGAAVANDHGWGSEQQGLRLSGSGGQTPKSRKGGPLEAPIPACLPSPSRKAGGQGLVLMQVCLGGHCGDGVLRDPVSRGVTVRGPRWMAVLWGWCEADCPLCLFPPPLTWSLPDQGLTGLCGVYLHDPVTLVSIVSAL